jgi:hypothetical protein
MGFALRFDTALKIPVFIGGGAPQAHGKLLAKSETVGNTTADWSLRGSFTTSVRFSNDFTSSIPLGEEHGGVPAQSPRSAGEQP